MLLQDEWRFERIEEQSVLFHDLLPLKDEPLPEKDQYRVIATDGEDESPPSETITVYLVPGPDRSWEKGL